MNQRTLDALRQSIRKYRNALKGTPIPLGIYACPLCTVSAGKCCNDCPVKERTGRGSCSGTPYYAMTKVSGEPDMTGPQYLYRFETEQQKEAVQAEIDFLVSLLPEGEAEEPQDNGCQ